MITSTNYYPSFGKLALKPEYEAKSASTKPMTDEEKEFLTKNSTSFNPDNHTFNRYELYSLDQYQDFQGENFKSWLNMLDRAINESRFQYVTILETRDSNFLAKEINRQEEMGIVKEVSPGIYTGNASDLLQAFLTDEELTEEKEVIEAISKDIELTTEMLINPSDYTKQYQVITFKVKEDITEGKKAVINTVLKSIKDTRALQAYAG